MKLLTLEQLLQLHALVMLETVGASELRDLGRLEAALATQTQNVFSEELYPEIPEKAAALIRGIIADHPFTDGNKRTAMLTGLTFLIINSVKLQIPKGELEDFAVKVAVAKLDVKQIGNWLRTYII